MGRSRGTEWGRRRGTPYETVGELRGFSEQELISKHDAWINKANNSPPMDTTHWMNRAQVYADELARREDERQGERMEALTRSMHILAWVGVAVAVVGVVLSLLTLLSNG